MVLGSLSERRLSHPHGEVGGSPAHRCRSGAGRWQYRCRCSGDHRRQEQVWAAGVWRGTAAEMSDQLIGERRRTLRLQAHRMGDVLQYGIPFRTGEVHKGGAFAGATCQRLPFSEL